MSQKDTMAALGFNLEAEDELLKTGHLHRSGNRAAHIGVNKRELDAAIRVLGVGPSRKLS